MSRVGSLKLPYHQHTKICVLVSLMNLLTKALLVLVCPNVSPYKHGLIIDIKKDLNFTTPNITCTASIM